MIIRMRCGEGIRTALALGATAALLAACHPSKKTVSGNDVQLRDMAVVDGTINDSMTDLDAANPNGLGTVNAATNASAPAKP